MKVNELRTYLVYKVSRLQNENIIMQKWVRARSPESAIQISGFEANQDEEIRAIRHDKINKLSIKPILPEKSPGEMMEKEIEENNFKN